MPLDPAAKRFLDMAGAATAGAAAVPTISARRTGLAKLMALARADRLAPPGRDGVIPGPGGDIPYRLYAPSDAPGVTPGLVFFHGGGLVAGSVATHDVVCRALAEESGCRIVSVDYRLAPEHPFPAALEDAFAATAWVSGNAASLDIDRARLAVGGDSGGATLAAATCQAARGGGPAIALQCLICPVLDSSTETDSRREFARGFLIDGAMLESDLAHYLPAGTEPADPRVSPLRARDLAGLPPAIIHTAEFDPLRDEGDAYAERLTAAGVYVEHVRHAGMVHNFHALGAVLPQGRAALAQIGGEIRAALFR